MVQVSPVQKKEGLLEGALMSYGKKFIEGGITGGLGGVGGEEAGPAGDLLGGAAKKEPVAAAAAAGTPGLGANPGDESSPCLPVLLEALRAIAAC
jgi:hypothetical protein